MIDTIKGYINLSQYKYEDVKHLLNEGRINKSKKTVAFNLLNFRFTLKFDEKETPVRLSFNGSLSKYYYGNNLAQLNWDDIEKAINELSDNLNINLNEAILTRLDIAVNLTLEKSVNNYIHNLYSTKKKGILIYNDSITFISTTKDITFYDKLKELKKNDKNTYHNLPIELKNKNILRYELRLKKNLKSHFNTNNFTIEHLFQLENQHKIVDLWVNHYLKINTFININAPISLLKKRNGLKDYLSYIGLKTIGIEKVINNIQTVDFNVKDIYSKRSKMKKNLNKFIKETKCNLLEDKKIIELNNKIELLSKLLKE